MIITLTMNPAIDKTVEVENFGIDKVNRISNVSLDAAGKGVNVSKLTRVLGGRTKTIAFLGGKNGAFIKQSLEDERLSLVSVPVENETRINTKIVDPHNKTFTDLNEAGPEVSSENLTVFVNQLISHATSETMVVLTGSVPKGVPKTVYKDLIERLNGFGAKTVLDASGELFKAAIEAKPTIIKPNIHELEMYAGHKLRDDATIIQLCKRFITSGIEIVVVSQGEAGALMITKDTVLKAKGLCVDVKSTVGAGDAMVAALCYGYEKKFPLKEIFSLAIASSAAQVMIKGTQVPDLELIYKLNKNVEITEI